MTDACCELNLSVRSRLIDYDRATLLVPRMIMRTRTERWRPRERYCRLGRRSHYKFTRNDVITVWWGSTAVAAVWRYDSLAEEKYFLHLSVRVSICFRFYLNCGDERAAPEKVNDSRNRNFSDRFALRNKNDWTDDDLTVSRFVIIIIQGGTKMRRNVAFVMEFEVSSAVSLDRKIRSRYIWIVMLSSKFAFCISIAIIIIIGLHTRYYSL